MQQFNIALDDETYGKIKQLALEKEMSMTDLARSILKNTAVKQRVTLNRKGGSWISVESIITYINITPPTRFCCGKFFIPHAYKENLLGSDECKYGNCPATMTFPDSRQVEVVIFEHTLNNYIVEASFVGVTTVPYERLTKEQSSYANRLKDILKTDKYLQEIVSKLPEGYIPEVSVGIRGPNDNSPMMTLEQFKNKSL